MSTPPPNTGAAAHVGSVLDGAYQLTRLIFEGGMGTVYEAVQLRLNKRVAVKVMVPDLATDAEALGRFRREVEVTAHLAHPHVTSLLDFGVAPSGAPYLVMEYLDGEDLDQRLNRVQRLPLPAVAQIVAQTASALTTIHRQGIIHRDLKPANIFLVALEGGEDFVKVVDFGISKVRTATTQLTRAFTMVGTPEAMSPEQATGRVDEVDHRCDQWGLACAAWRMITGVRPFSGSTLTEFLQQVVSADPPPMASLIPDAPADVELVLRRALAKRQDDRFPTIAAFGRAFQTAVNQSVSPDATATTKPTTKPVTTKAAPTRPALARAPTLVLAVVTLTSLAIGGVLIYRAGGAALLRSQVDRATNILDGGGSAAPTPAARPRPKRPTSNKTEKPPSR